MEELRARVGRYPADRYPVQHATAQFHLGSVLLQAGQADAALAALAAAENVFAGTGMPLERAKAMMAHGAALRSAGRPDVALLRFGEAAEAFAELGQVTEEAAARHNLGLVLVETGQLDRALVAFETAARLFHDMRQRAWAGASEREHGAVLLRLGRAADAVSRLERAVIALADTEPAGAGAAANTLGLARLASGDPGGAVEALIRALAWHPSSLRPAEHAMAKANLALAEEQAGAPAQARLAAHHALVVEEAARPVRMQAQGVLDRLPGSSGSDLWQVLDDEPQHRHQIWARDELSCWTRLDDDTAVAAVAAWVRAQAARGAEGADYAVLLLGALLELPPPAYVVAVQLLVRATADVGGEEAERFQRIVGSAMARYPLPQWQRMAASLTAAAQRWGPDQQWR
jgi:tetratricopeptide (TPR) repeat protein